MTRCEHLSVRCAWAPTGLHVRMIISNAGDTDVVGLQIDARARSGHPLRLVPGNRGGKPVDLSHVPAQGSIWMNVEPIGDGPVTLSPLVVDLRAPGIERCRLEDIPIED